MDVSNILDKEGELFLDRVDNKITNILIEIEVDAGPLGILKRAGDYHNAAPFPMIVVNDPLAGELENINTDASILSSFVKGVQANVTNFAGWCGPCYGTSLADIVSCPESTLKARGCKEEKTDMQEAINAVGKCAGNVQEGDYACASMTECKVCTKIEISEGKYKYRFETTERANCAEKSCGEGGGSTTKPQCSTSIPGKCDIGNSTGEDMRQGIVYWKCSNAGTMISCSLREADSLNTKPQCSTSIPGKCDIGNSTGEDMRQGIVYWKCSNAGTTISCSLVENPGPSASRVCGAAANNNYSLTTTEISRDLCGEGYTARQGGQRIGSVLFPESDNAVSWYCCPGASGCIQCTASKKTEEDPPPPPEPEYSTDHCWENKSKTRASKIVNGQVLYCKRTTGKWEKDNAGPVEKKVNKACLALSENLFDTSCETNHAYCFLENGKAFLCESRFWVEVQKEDISQIVLDKLPIVENRKECDSAQCACPGDSVDNFVYETEYCREVDNTSQDDGAPTCSNPNNEGKICSREGQTCKNGVCDGPKPEEIKGVQDEALPSSLSIFNTKAIAQETNSSESKNTRDLIIDSQTGTISNIEEGSYVIKVGDEYYSFDVTKGNLDADNGSILLFIDKNENGKYDEGIDTLVSDLATSIKIVDEERTYRYELKQGFNFVSFPFLVLYDHSRTASSLLESLNEAYHDSIYSISKYDGTWKVVGQNQEVYDNNDFQLIPGQGYVIKAKRNISIVIPGKPVQYESSSDSAPITFFEGWNLVGLYGTGTKSYTAKSLIKSINGYEPINFTADNVSRWETDTQKYDGFQLTVEGGRDMEYGFDYPLNQLQSYFVRIKEGRGNWQPELAK